ncbi:MAG: AAA family ATPase [Chlorobiales bacterium]|nr:AAA family ATPase [Chlorobiales bacterium]
MMTVEQALRLPSAYPHPVEEIVVVETHISLVFLTGPYAYKTKKAVNLGFLDFSTLEKRKHFCREELRLNRRLCADLYLDVVPVTERSGTIMIGSKGRIIDYAVKMVQFDRRLELDTLLLQGKITGEQIDEISRTVAAFHESSPAAEPDKPYGRPEILIKPVRDNFIEAERLNRNPQETKLLEKLKKWTETEYRRLMPIFLFRKAGGAIRECHGDMHTGNMVLWKKRVMIFDCIEFNPFLSTIDVISEISFLVMDLEHSGHPEHAWRFLNDYLSLTGDYEGLPLIRFYKTYRAMVRAKVTAIRHFQEKNRRKKEQTLAEHRSYIVTALSYASPEPFGLVITCGVSGSGKTTVARELASRMQAIHIRSDVERKRIFGLRHCETSSPGQSKAIYSETSSQQTYAKLYDIASGCLENSYRVIVDATFLREEERKRFISLGKNKNLPVIILFCEAPETFLEERVTKRQLKGKDASEADTAVLRQQIRNLLPLSASERNITITIDTSLPSSIEQGIAETIMRIRKKDKD